MLQVTSGGRRAVDGLAPANSTKPDEEDHTIARAQPLYYEIGDRGACRRGRHRYGPRQDLVACGGAALP